jgi:hypothetical protein
MSKRIGLWALGGATVALIWALAFYSLGPSRGFYPGQADLLHDLSHSAALSITIPLALVFRHYPITWYESAILNAASYACIGLLFETLRMTMLATLARARH